MQSMIRYLFLSAWRDRTFYGLVAILIFASLVSFFLGNTALVEQKQMQLAYIAGSHRVILVVGVVLLICLQVRQQFHNKEIELFLAMPQPRHKLILAYMLAYSFISVLITVPTIILVVWKSDQSAVAVLVWALSLIAELILISLFALAASLIIDGSVVAIFASMAFYIVSRMMGFVSSAIPMNFRLPGEGWVEYLIEMVVKLVSIFIPRLDLFANTSWLIYGIDNDSNIWLVIGQFFIYLLLLWAITATDFNRKQF